MNVAIITDSFPPMMDGVSRCVLGYSCAFHAGGYGNLIVVTPKMPKMAYDYPFGVHTFKSVPLPYAEYRFGFPFMPGLVSRLREMKVDVIHSHSPFTAMTIARQLRFFLNVPVVFTQHTKWNYDIHKAVPVKPVAKAILWRVYSNIKKADEVWAVSSGAGEYLIDNGFTGSYRVMPNGTDFPNGEASEAAARQISAKHNLPEGVPVLLFVGRMMWYKNIKLIIEALEVLFKQSFPFRMVFVGDGEDLGDIKKMAAAKGLANIIKFAGRITDREVLRAYYTRADLFVFPSLYDTAGLVVSEAAACKCPSLVIRYSSAAEVVEENVTGFLANESAGSIAEAIQDALADYGRLKTVGVNASKRIYLPWDSAVKNSLVQYERIIGEFRKKQGK